MPFNLKVSIYKLEAGNKDPAITKGEVMETVKKLCLTGLQLEKELDALLALEENLTDLSDDEQAKLKQEYIAIWFYIMSYNLQGKRMSLIQLATKLDKHPKHIQRYVGKMLDVGFIEADKDVITKASLSIAGFEGYIGGHNEKA